MKICCYEKFITVSSGTAYRSAVRDTRWGSLPGPGATVRALAAVGRQREGQVPAPFILPLGTVVPQQRVGWLSIGSRGRLRRGAAAARPKVPFSLHGAPLADAAATERGA